MKNEYSMNNQSFDILRGSPDFLNLVLNNLNSCVLLLDKQMKLRAFNDALKTIFTNKEDEDLLYIRCGEAIGCAYRIEEGKECGTTSHCGRCELRIASMESYLNDEAIYKDHVRRPFFDRNNKKKMKDLQFSTRLFKYRDEKFIVMLVEDITEVVALKAMSNRQQSN
jgi:sigma-B regulation protein RsbU (phosphoserine phosphatase)